MVHNVLRRCLLYTVDSAYGTIRAIRSDDFAPGVRHEVRLIRTNNNFLCGGKMMRQKRVLTVFVTSRKQKRHFGYSVLRSVLLSSWSCKLAPFVTSATDSTFQRSKPPSFSIMLQCCRGTLYEQRFFLSLSRDDQAR